LIKIIEQNTFLKRMVVLQYMN